MSIDERSREELAVARAKRACGIDGSRSAGRRTAPSGASGSDKIRARRMIVVMNHVSLDGVLQAPGRPDEDTRDGFAHGGWATAGMTGSDPVISAAMGARMGENFAWLFGRRSYEDMLGHWNAVGGPFKDGLNNTPKYVVSRNPDVDLPWPHSIPVVGDLRSELVRLRDESERNLVIMGSGELIRSLLPLGLVDVLLLFVHPVVLGSGARIFGPDDDAHRWRLLDTAAAESGVVVTSYEAV